MEIEKNRRNFLNSVDILRNLSLAFILKIGGNIYFDVGADEKGPIYSRIHPPASATHVLFGAGLKSENTLKLAVVATKEEVLQQRDYGYNEDRKARKVRNYFTYYNASRAAAIGFTGDENIQLGGWDYYDSNKAIGYVNAFELQKNLQKS